MLLAIACMAGFTSFSQSFMHGVGTIIFVDKAADSDAGVIGGLTYSPRFNFLEKDNLSVSIGVPLSVGVSGSYSANYGSYSGESNSLSFMFDAPLMINLNLGCGSTKESDRRFGFFIGAGYGYHYGTSSESFTDFNGYEYSDNVQSSTTGPAGNLGVRFGVGRSTHNIEVKLAYMKGLNDTKPNIFSLGGLFNF